MERLLLADKKLDKIIFRPSYIYGKYDPTERFYYWLYRVQNCDKFLLPDGGQPKSLSLSNAADLTQALLQAIEIKNRATIYNAVSTPATSIRELIETAATAYDKQPDIITADNTNLKNFGLEPSQFPLLTPLGFSISNTLWEKDFQFVRADIATTLIEMRDHKAKAGFPLPPVGLSIEKEKEVLDE